ncbi:peptidylprolyl isomerase [Mycobacteroides abscessus]|uniref:Cyclophilin type peptidyl-prolyl cis-trans isomerase/CLD family protein n=3 Tax=Mycobacteroides abscessus TaxID=36809 RepID=A0A829QFY1_9MYCO|nr:peptidylprolyl isomerase [Mycobacteroides abscessus]EUA61473.1 cyclophilin type peptidyl-prolyl cis-trans isomerase/CLD family protein [Mycobacteroides abscessus 1948]ALM17080.1 peptidylprolyl isomerase [Mycobacteroides abscessus]AMU46291.1 peptidylprolyl isomerase [Mycobacteroides abscessus]AMU51184.1 peptidylprolyl isomerase [Mycobacteroides abscessus]ANO09868.1 peptidylprolyl isomerase [Mycobacteroides abscessus]
MPTNEQRRQTAKRKLERQLENRAERARKQRIWAISGVAVLAVVVAVAITAWFAISKGDKTDTAHDTASTTPVSTVDAPPTSSLPTPDEPPLAGPALPKFVPSAEVGANCQYRPSGKASKTIEKQIPRTGKIPTDPATLTASMKTSQGNIGLVLDNAKAPCTVNSFASLAQGGYFDNTVCHRMTSGGLSVLQCGDPTATGSGGPGYEFDNEYPTTQYKADDPAAQQAVVYPAGTLAMANAGPGTNGSQFFMVYKDSKLPPQYTVFGTIDKTGMDTLAKIAKNGIKPGARGAGDGEPAQEVKIIDLQLD